MPATNEAEKERTRRLRSAIKRGRDKLKTFIDVRLQMLGEYVGHLYGDNRGQRALPMNVLAGAVMALVPQLVLGRIKPQVRSLAPKGDWAATLLRLWLERWAEDSDFSSIRRSTVTDAMFGPGIYWVGRAPGRQVEAFDYLMDVGVAAVDRVSLDAYLVDPDATRRSQVTFEGHRADLPVEYVLDEPRYRNKEKLVAVTVGERDEESARALSGKRSGVQEPFIPTVPLDIVWLPRGWSGRDAPLVVTLPPEHMGDLPLTEDSYDGPERGPYEMVEFHEVPDNLMPLAPTCMFYDLHSLINRIARKLERQIDREKVVALVQQGAAEDGKTVKSAADGDVICVQDPKAFTELRFGGGGLEKFQTINWLLQFFSRQAGNLDLMAGIQTGAPTLGQEEILAGNASIRLDSMRQEERRVGTEVLRKVGWYLWTDALLSPVLEQRVTGIDFPLTTELTPEMRAEMKVSDLRVSVAAQAARDSTPEELASKLVAWINWYLPLAQNQGLSVNVAEAGRKVGEWMGLDETESLMQERMLGEPEFMPTEMAGAWRGSPAGSVPRGNLTLRTGAPNKGPLGGAELVRGPTPNAVAGPVSG